VRVLACFCLLIAGLVVKKCKKVQKDFPKVLDCPIRTKRFWPAHAHLSFDHCQIVPGTGPSREVVIGACGAPHHPPLAIQIPHTHHLPPVRQAAKSPTHLLSSRGGKELLSNSCAAPERFAMGTYCASILAQLRRISHQTPPILRASITSGTIMACGDGLCQIWNPVDQYKNNPSENIAAAAAAAGQEVSLSKSHVVAVLPKLGSSVCEDAGGISATRARVTQGWRDLDWHRTLNFAFVGSLLHGPFFYQ